MGELTLDGGVPYSCHRETHTSWWTVWRAPVPPGGGHRVQVHPLSSTLPGETGAGRALGLVPPCGKVGASKRLCLHPWITLQVSLRTRTPTCTSTHARVLKPMFDKCCRKQLWRPSGWGWPIIVLIHQFWSIFTDICWGKIREKLWT